jgi:FKBP-type peptidyl-prolyl cis-trans isomerase
MKASVFSALLISSALLVSSCDNASKTEKFDGKLDEEGTRFSYALGMEIGKSLKNIGAEINHEAFFAGVKTSFSGDSALLTEEEAAEVKGTVFNRVKEEKSAKVEAEGQVTLKAEKEFLEANKAKEGVISLPSGLQYKIIKDGTGANPKPSDKIKMNYRGTLIDGTEFDNSSKMGAPAEFAVGQIIPGMSEGLQLMKVGGKYQMWIPAALAYGPRQMSEIIKPYSTLIFEVELLGIVK